VNTNGTKTRSGRKAGALVVAFAALSFVVSVPRVQAEDAKARCQHHIEKAESRLDEAVRRHGEHSRQADDRRRELNAEREHCWGQFHQYWDGHAHQWHEQHDWDIVISH